MSIKVLVATVSAIGLASVACAADMTYTNGDTIVFGNGTASIHGEQTTAPQSLVDTFFFDVATLSNFSGTISTHGLMNNNGDVVSHLDFTSAKLTGPGDFVYTYAIPAIAADETISLNSMSLATGRYTLSIGYNTTIASTANSASYDGGLHLVSSDVPEPASWAMFIGGFGLMGGVMRRKKAVVSFA